MKYEHGIKRHSKTCLTKGAFGKHKPFPMPDLKVLKRSERIYGVNCNGAGVRIKKEGSFWGKRLTER